MTSEIGHNSEQDEAARKANFFLRLRSIELLKAKVDQARTEYNQERKLAKADGIKLKRIDYALDILTGQDDTIAAEDLRERIETAQWLNVPFGHQVNFADVDRRDAVEKAYAAGEFAGMRQKDQSDHDYKGDLEQEFLKGYNVGRERLQAVSQAEEAEGAELLKNVGTGSEEADDDPFDEDEDQAEAAE